MSLITHLTVPHLQYVQLISSSMDTVMSDRQTDRQTDRQDNKDNHINMTTQR